MQAIVTASVNPDKALEAFTSYLKLMMPEYEELRDQMDQDRMKIFHREQEMVFAFSAGHNGWAAKQEKRD